MPQVQAERAQYHWEFRELLDKLFHLRYYAQQTKELRALREDLRRAKCANGIERWKAMVTENQQHRLALGHFVQRIEQQSLLSWRLYIARKIQFRMTSAAVAAWECSAMSKAVYYLQQYARDTTAALSAWRTWQRPHSFGNNSRTALPGGNRTRPSYSMQTHLAIQLAELKHSPRKTASYEEFVRQRKTTRK